MTEKGEVDRRMGPGPSSSPVPLSLAKAGSREPIADSPAQRYVFRFDVRTPCGNLVERKELLPESSAHARRSNGNDTSHEMPLYAIDARSSPREDSVCAGAGPNSAPTAGNPSAARDDATAPSLGAALSRGPQASTEPASKIE
jgi:hypothetical protein